MGLLDIFKESFRTLTVNKLRTGLAMLGIVIGIASVIALISLGQASQQQVQNSINSLGANLLTVMPGSVNSGAVRGAAGGGTTLTNADATAISNNPSVTDVSAVAPQYSGRGQVATGAENTNTSIIGTTPNYASISDIQMQEGSFISQSDEAGMRKVAVLGPQVVATLWPNGQDPIGQQVLIKGISFIVEGVTVSKGGSGFANKDDTIYIPLTTAQEIVFGTNYLTSISVSATSQNTMTAAENQVGYLLLQRHHISSPANADFSVISQADIASAASSTTGTFTALLSGIAGISLLVGGIGIMNIMLVTVTERIREIGLRKALGAKKKIIITQFLSEAILLTFAGGLVGMFLGIALSFIIAQLISLPFTLSFSSIFLAIGVSGGIGIIFGWYPAQRAANLSPIEALRYE